MCDLDVPWCLSMMVALSPFEARQLESSPKGIIAYEGSNVIAVCLRYVEA